MFKSDLFISRFIFLVEIFYISILCGQNSCVYITAHICIENKTSYALIDNTISHFINDELAQLCQIQCHNTVCFAP